MSDDIYIRKHTGNHASNIKCNKNTLITKFKQVQGKCVLFLNSNFRIHVSENDVKANECSYASYVVETLIHKIIMIIIIFFPFCRTFTLININKYTFDTQIHIFTIY